MRRTAPIRGPGKPRVSGFGGRRGGVEGGPDDTGLSRLADAASARETEIQKDTIELYLNTLFPSLSFSPSPPPLSDSRLFLLGRGGGLSLSSSTPRSESPPGDDSSD